MSRSLDEMCIDEIKSYVKSRKDSRYWHADSSTAGKVEYAVACEDGSFDVAMRPSARWPDKPEGVLVLRLASIMDTPAQVVDRLLFVAEQLLNRLKEEGIEDANKADAVR